MDPILYFLSHSLLLHLLLAAVAFAFGLGVGWWLWSKFQQQCRSLQGEVVKERERAAKMMRERDDLHHARNEQQAAKASVNGDVSRLKSTVTSLEQEKQNLFDIRVNLENELSESRDRVEALEQQAVKATDENHALQLRAEEAEGPAVTLREEVTSLQRNLEALKQSRSEAQNHARQLETELASARQETEVASKTRDGQLQTRNLLQSQATQLGEELNRVKQQLVQATREKEELSKAAAELVTFRNSAEAELVKLKTQQGDLFSHHSTLEGEVTRLRQQVMTLTQERDQHTQSRAQLQAANRSLEEELVRLRAENWEEKCLAQEQEIIALKARHAPPELN